MLVKRVLCPTRIRKLPRQFSWVDQRLVRERYMERCDTHALALYLFLVTVADAKGLSYYSDTAIARCLSMDDVTLRKARRDLMQARLVAYEKPLYQILALDLPYPVGDTVNRRGQLRSMREWLARSLPEQP
jgi:hypothetical protein